MPHLSYNLGSFLLASAMLASSMGLLTIAAKPFVRAWHAPSFAATEAESRGIGTWPLEATTDCGSGVYRFVYRNPIDAKAFADLTVKYDGTDWKVVGFNKDLRP